MAKIKSFPWDVSEHLESEEEIAAYLESALYEGDSELLIVALNDVAAAMAKTKPADSTE